MMYEKKLQWVVLFVLVILSDKLLRVNARPEVPCFFIFGDSLADNGNNNNLRTLAKANYPPYGVDYPDGPTGRFTNGRNTVDFLAELLGFNHHIPSFASASGKITLQGVNYASGSSGIRDETGRHLGQNVNMNQQIRNHVITVQRLNSMLGHNGTAMRQLRRCLYGVGTGSNDYLNNYFTPQHYQTGDTYTQNQYASALVSQYSTQLTTLYKFGARKFALVGLGNIGCIPRSVAKFRTSGSICADKMNKAISLFNQKLINLVRNFNHLLPDAKFIYVNTSSLGEGDPSQLGFKNFMSGCCEAREDGQCIENKRPCPNRKAYTFWDSFHPTEASNALVAARIYQSFSRSDNYPFDLHTLASLNLRLKSKKSVRSVRSGRKNTN